MNTKLHQNTEASIAAAIEAARQGDTQQLSFSLSSGISSDTANQNGDTLVMLAAYHGHEQAVEFLLEHGADPNITNSKGQHPISGASYKGQTNIVKLLLEHGADPEGGTVNGTQAHTPLMYAAMYNKLRVVQALLAAGG